jgi:small subunit ribosomal protein S20
MPIIKNAIRKLRADKRKSAVNLRTKQVMKQAISGLRKKPSEKQLKEAFSKLDKAVKSQVIHKNKAARLKSRLSSLLKK